MIISVRNNDCSSVLVAGGSPELDSSLMQHLHHGLQVDGGGSLSGASTRGSSYVGGSPSVAVGSGWSFGTHYYFRGPPCQCQLVFSLTCGPTRPIFEVFYDRLMSLCAGRGAAYVSLRWSGCRLHHCRGLLCNFQGLRHWSEFFCVVKGPLGGRHI